MSTIQHLTELLDQKNELLRVTKEKLDDFERREDSRPADWLLPLTYRKGEDPLPQVSWPRVHMRCEQIDGSWDVCLWTHYLVMRSMYGETTYWPMGITTDNRRRPSLFSGKPDLAEPPERTAQAMPMRQGKDAELLALQLNIPLFMEVDGVVSPIRVQQFVRDNYAVQKEGSK
jgi:hypothetical protein